MVVFSLSKNSLKSKNKVGGGEASVTTQVRIAVSCCALLGLTWIFGILAIGEARLVFQYVFCILNSLQGAFIFYFNILRQSRTLEAWRGLLTGKGCRYYLTSVALSQSSHNRTRSTFSNKDTRDGSSQNTEPVPLPEFRMPPKRISFDDALSRTEREDILPPGDPKENTAARDNSNFQAGTPAASLQFTSFVEC